jgi:opacity protein-like surface antigen
MKRILIASAVALAAGGQALAADLPPPAPMPRAPATYVPIVAPPYNWTGFYIGGNLGGAFTNGNFNTNIAGATVTTTSSTSFIGGGQVGANYQFWGGVVIGAEAMFDWLPNTKNTITLSKSSRYPRRQRDNQQSMADNRDRQARLWVGSRAALRQGRRRLGRREQFWDHDDPGRRGGRPYWA